MRLWSQRRSDRAATKARERDDIARQRWRGIASWIRTVAGILVALAAAESISVGAAHFAGYDITLELQPAPILTLIFGNLLSSFAVAIPVRAAADSDAELWRRLTVALKEQTRPDSGYYTQRVVLQPDKTKTRFLEDVDDVPGDGTEILVLLKQTQLKTKKASANNLYSLSNMQEQIGPLLDRKDLARFKWVCFVTRDGEFVAYQDFLSFAFALNYGSKQEYERILNINDSKAFRTRLRDHRGDKWSGQVGFNNPDLIIGLEYGSVKEPITRKEALVVLAVCGGRDGPVSEARNHLMLIDKKKRPVGIVTPRELLKSALLNVAVTRKEQDQICEKIKVDDGWDGDGETDAATGTTQPSLPQQDSVAFEAEDSLNGEDAHLAQQPTPGEGAGVSSVADLPMTPFEPVPTAELSDGPEDASGSKVLEP